MKSVYVLTMVLLFSVAALPVTKPVVNDESLNPTVQDYTVPVEQQSTYIRATGNGDEYAPKISDYEFTSASWSPSALNRASLIPADTNFQTGPIPMLGVARVSPYRYALGGVIETDFGVYYARLTRNGTVASSSSDTTVKENLDVAAVKMGMSYRVPGLGTRFLQPSLELDVMPTWIASERSAFEQYGVNALGVIFAADIKLMYCPDFMQAPMGAKTGEGVGVAYLVTEGSVGGSDMSGSGLQGILRMGF